MKWQGRRRSSNVQDTRGRGGARRGLKLSGGISGFGIVAVIVVLLLGGDPSQILGLLLGGQDGSAPSSSQSTAPAANDPGSEFVSVILADTEQTWNRLFKASGSTYPEPQLILFSDGVQSACGYSTTASGPFYCPPDQKVYLDLGFFRELDRLGAPGDFAQAYVIGHEVAHHVQQVTGILDRVQQLKARTDKVDSNKLQVMVELQADCYAGVWAYHAEDKRDLLERGDVEEGLRAAAAIGDDRLQKNAGRRVQPEAFTHGSSADRQKWFNRGMQSGEVSQCDTFAASGQAL